MIAYGTLTLIGFGGIPGEMAAFKDMEDLQVTVLNRGMGAKNRSVSSGLLFFYSCVRLLFELSAGGFYIDRVRSF